MSPRVRRISALVLVTLTSAGCSEQSSTAIRPRAAANALDDARPASPATPTTSVRWNEVSRTLVASHNTNGPMASRVYALVSVAQFGAVTAVDIADRENGPHASHDSSRGATDHPSLTTAIARASSDVLSKLYPDSATQTLLAAKLKEDEALPTGPQAKHADVHAGDVIGALVAQVVLARAATDGAAAADCPTTPPTPSTQFWHDDAAPPNPQPQLPCFGKIRPWLPIDIAQFRVTPAPPPALGSPAFLAGLAEVRHISDTRTAQQLATVDKWLDGNNSFTPPGHWNLIASDLIARHGLNDAAAARVLAVLNVVMMDTHIACWDRKYTFWELRPWMVDSQITTPRGQPHHPSNPSGHGCAGGAGSGALAGLFPAERDSLLALGDEEGFTTVQAGVHYRFDVDDGSRIGRLIAAKALELNGQDDSIRLMSEDVVRRSRDERAHPR